jgi:hypothetical protein
MDMVGLDVVRDIELNRFVVWAQIPASFGRSWVSSK